MASQPDNLNPAETTRALQMFDAMKTQGELVSAERRPVNLQPGDATIFRLTRVKDITGRRPETGEAHTYSGYEGETKTGEKIIVLESGNMGNFITAQLVGKVLGVACIGTLPTGKASPMKVFEVVNFGDTFPTAPKPKRTPARSAASDTDDDLPF